MTVDAAVEKSGRPIASTWRGVVRSARPKQWLKNVLVLAAPGAAGLLDGGRELGLTLLAFVAFCLAASGTYVWNDLLDLTADRAHPTKRHRPIAAGVVSVGLARVVGVVLLIAGLGVAALTGRWQTVAILGIYIGITLAYSIWLKHVAVVDLVTIASGFVLRAAAGAVAIDIPMSSWFVLCITFGSLFIVTGKRYAELNELGDGAQVSRATLGTYSLGYLR
ncbi:MAG: decaprenyl-phosphate phosphoribosyltransferase, partial [Ilumatobacteraceae bacterium]